MACVQDVVENYILQFTLIDETIIDVPLTYDIITKSKLFKNILDDCVSENNIIPINYPIKYQNNIDLFINLLICIPCYDGDSKNDNYLSIKYQACNKLCVDVKDEEIIEMIQIADFHLIDPMFNYLNKLYANRISEAIQIL